MTIIYMIDLARSASYLLGLASTWVVAALLYRLIWQQRYGTIYGARLRGRVDQVRAGQFRIQRQWVSVGSDLGLHRPMVGQRITVDGIVGSTTISAAETLYRSPPINLPGFVALKIRSGSWPQLRFITRAGFAVWVASAALVAFSTDPPPPLPDVPALALVDDDPEPLRLGVATRVPQVRFEDVQTRDYEHLHPDVIPRVIRRNFHHLTYCFSKHTEPSDLITEVQLSLPLDSDGVVIGAHFRRASGTPYVDRCVRENVLNWRFPCPNSKSALVEFSVVVQWQPPSA